ncbi:MAG: elongation factor P, partial [Flavobacteriales bacterium]
FVRTKLKSVTTGKVLENTFNAGARVDEVRIERRPHQFLYNDELGFHFMDDRTYEQTSLEESQIPNPDLLKEGNKADILFYADEEKPMSCELPPFVELEVSYTEPGAKGDTATNTLKEAKLETDAKVKVPLFINTGDIIKVDTRSRQYNERVKENK